APGTARRTALALTKLGATVLGPGAGGGDARDDVTRGLIASATHLHLGAVDATDPEAAAALLTLAREQGVITAADLGAPAAQAGAVLERIAPLLLHLDVFLPDAAQALALTGTADLAAAGAALQAGGVGVIAVSSAADGAVVIDARGVTRVPALPVEVVDSTGCRDAFGAGFLRGLALGRSPADAARLGVATAACVAQGPGADFGEFDLSLVEGLAYS
ncbi:MAG TPA: PfkB family carbohydrate kinase, partial [Solirubrobacteraceae bacterium]|nr:PfkB family carbohydrate kinase [Solirubrobacteraceae bacterium]